MVVGSTIFKLNGMHIQPLLSQNEVFTNKNYKEYQKYTSM